ncbi:hypothetical protein R1flu_025816 [Riccia fluitans]|uniref:Uncharacterized protein n=1 Tax=Riccia fluitans TaxID=41844 RepID=A0ABD1XYU2_9MARC
MEEEGPASSLSAENQLTQLQNSLAESEREQEHLKNEVIRPLEDWIKQLATQLEHVQTSSGMTELLTEFNQVSHNLTEAQELNQQLQKKNLVLTKELRQKGVQELRP